MHPSKKKKNIILGRDECNRFLTTVTVFGSPGPIRFIVNEKDVVSNVIDTALKIYAREGRLPVLSSDTDDFVLYCPFATTFEALEPFQAIGSLGFRNFMMCKKPPAEKSVDINGKVTPLATRKRSGKWKNWFNKALKHKISAQ